MRLLRSRINRSGPCLALLLVWMLAGVQVSGLHLHLPDDGHVHVHATYAPGHGHGADHDVLDEVGHAPLTLLIKLLLAFPLALIVLLLAVPCGGGRSYRAPTESHLSRRACPRLHPPLRAPPPGA